MARLTRAQRVAGAAFSTGGSYDPAKLLGVLGNRKGWRVTQDGMERAIGRLAELNVAAESALQTVIAEESDRALANIKARWPVDTGFSKNRWQRVFRSKFRVELQNDARYVEYVHRKGNRTPLVDSLVPDEIRRARARILRRLRSIVRGRVAEFRGRGIDLGALFR